MSEMLPVSPSRQTLPFHRPDFTWDVFEEFFCSFLAAQPTLTVFHNGQSLTRQIKTARPYNKRGASQEGIDICATVEGGGAMGEVWAFQCKHHAKWTRKQTEKAIAACTYEASHKFLLLTCDVGEDSREVIHQHPDWTLWDGPEITQQFLTQMSGNPSVGSEILYRCFGKDWDTKFFSVPGTGPLLTPDAFFMPWRDPKRYFHHNLDLVGRRDRFADLDSFVKTASQRVLLLTGRGGIGKSRLLAEWTRGFSQRHHGVLVRFASHEHQDFERHLPRHGERMVIVLDDAHQQPDLRKQLFAAAIRRDGVQLVVSLRPGPNEDIRRDLDSAGFDISHIVGMPELGRLSDDDALLLARKSLEPGFDTYADVLYQVSKDCPLIAVIGGELIKSGEVTFASLGAHQDIRRVVFDKLEEQARVVAGEFPEWQEIMDFLGLIALLSPVRNDDDFRVRAAECLGGGWQSHRISRLIEALEHCGVLLVGGAGLRITPDLFSDHIAYRACYDTHGRARGFVERVLASFSEKATETVVRHLAEAEWRASGEHEQPDSIIQPVWEMFRSRFLTGSFFQRAELLVKWGNIAVLRPRETLEFVNLAIKEAEAPMREPENPVFGENSSVGQYAMKLDSHQNVLDQLPPLLKATGAHHKEYTAHSLDILWRLARERDDNEENNESHPLTAMAAVIAYERWKPAAICEAGLAWLERFLARGEWLHAKFHPGNILRVLVKPFLAVWLDTTFWMRRKVVVQYVPVSLDAVRGMRDRALALCRSVLGRNEPALTMAVIDLADEAAAPLRSPFGGSVSPQIEASWLEERRKGLALLGEAIDGQSNPAILVAVRRKLLELVRRKDEDDLASDCQRLLRCIPDTLETRTTRALYSYAHDEFDESYSDGWGKRARERWEEFLAEVSGELVMQFASAASLAGYLDRISTQGDEVGWQNPGFRGLFTVIAKQSVPLAAKLTEIILANPNHRIAPSFDLLVHETTRDDLPTRLELYRRGLASREETLRASAIYGLSWWRREGGLPDEARSLIEDAAPTASPLVAWSIAAFVEYLPDPPTERDIALLTKLPLPPEATGLSARLLDILGNMLTERWLPNLVREAIAQVLARLVLAPELGEGRFQHELVQIAESAPVEVFQFFSARYFAFAHGRTPKAFRALPYWISELPLSGFSDSPSFHDTVTELGKRLLEHEPDHELSQLLRTALFSGTRDAEPFLNELLDLADTAEKLKRLLVLMLPSHRRTSTVLEVPMWAKRCLERARGFGDGVYADVRRQILTGFSRGGAFTNGEPDAETKGHVEAVERLAHEYATDSELGSLFKEAASYQRAWLKRHRDQFLT